MKKVRKAKWKLNSLRPQEYDEVSVVDSGANQDAHVVLVKRDGEGGSAMPKTGLIAKRVIRSCGQGHVVSKSDTACGECGDTEFTRSLMVVRKDELVDEEPDDDDDSDDEEVVEDEADDDDLDDDDAEEEDDGAEVGKNVIMGYGRKGKKKRNRLVEDDETVDEDEDVMRKSVAIDTAGASLTLVEKLSKIFSSGKSKRRIEKAYEDAMVEYNTVLDAAAQQWLAGRGISKSDGSSVVERLTEILKEEGADMPKVKRPTALDALELPDDVASYIGKLEKAAGIESEEDIYKGLDPALVHKLKMADELVEREEVKKWDDIAKSFRHYPGDKGELAKSLRALHDSDPDAYEVVRKTLEAGEFNLKQSSIFSTMGSSQGGDISGDMRIAKRREKAQELVDKGAFPTLEQAEVSLMGGADYRDSVDMAE